MSSSSKRRSLSHTRAERALTDFLSVASRAHELGVGSQLIEDGEFHGDTVIIHGEKVANFGLCSYLGLGDDPRLIHAAVDAVRRYGNSYSSSIAYTALPGYGELSERFEEIFDASVVLAGTTTLAHLAALPVMIRKDHLALVDSQAHASLLAATPTLQANGVDVEMVRHNDVGDLERRISEAGDRPVWLITDGVFSMHGDTAPPQELARLLDTHANFHAYVDDAHGFGWDGLHGRGNFLRYAGWHDRLVISVGLAKSFGTMGGVVAMKDADLAHLVKLTGAPLVFGGPLPPAILGASVASADIHLSDELPGLQDRLNMRISLVNRFSAEIGLPLALREHTPLWFLEVRTGQNMLEMLSRMRQSGFFLNGAVFPVVPRGHAGVRFTVTNYNSPTQIEAMLTCLNEHRLEMMGETRVEIDLDDVSSVSQRAPVGDDGGDTG